MNIISNHTLKVIDGVPFITRRGIEIPYQKLKEFPNSCGAGQGFWERIVPERIYFLRISPACYFHDIDMEFTEPTEEGFLLMNYIFLINTLSIINFKSKWEWLKPIRRYRAITYYNAVNTRIALREIFWELKRQQKEMGQWLDFNLRDIIFDGRPE